MAKKHFDAYYNQVYAQLTSLNKVFDEMSKEVNEGMVAPERLEQLVDTIEPIRLNYQTLSYIKYLLDMPNKKSKKPKYKQVNDKLLKIAGSRDGEKLLKKNADILNSLNK